MAGFHGGAPTRATVAREEGTTVQTKMKRTLAGVVLALGGLGTGVALGVTGSASATTDGATPDMSSYDPSHSVRPDEHLLTGTTAQKVTAAVKGKYPDATFERVETDSDGVYEAHIVTSDGEHLIVQVDGDYTVTGTDSGGGHFDGGGHDGGDDGPAPGA